MPDDGFLLRKAEPAEFDAVLRAIYEGFSTGDYFFDYRPEMPYLWIEERVPNHWICLREGKIVGVVGVYPFGVRLAGVEFRSAGIGQVATVPSARGQGVMSRILRVAMEEMDRRYDFTWLWGCRLRYGRFGWAWGWTNYHFETRRRYLPDPPRACEVRRLDPDEHVERIHEFAEAQPYTVHFSRDEFRKLLARPATRVAGYRDAWVLYNVFHGHATVWLADGPEQEIAALLSHLLREAEECDRHDVIFTTGPFDGPLMRVGRRYRMSLSLTDSACLRICDMAGYFSNAARIAEPALAGGSDELSLRNTDNGQEVCIRCRDGRFAVSDRAGSDAREMSTADISEAAFSALPLDTTMPGLAPDSPLRALLQVPVHVSHLYFI